MKNQEGAKREINGNISSTNKFNLSVSILKSIFYFLRVVLLLITLAIVVISISILLQEYLAGHITNKNMIFSLLNINYGIQELNYHCLRAIGYSSLVAAPLLPTSKNKIKSVILFIGSILLLLSIIFLFQTNYFIYSLQRYILEPVFAFCIVFISLSHISERFEHLFKPFSLILLVTVTMSIFLN